MRCQHCAYPVFTYTRCCPNCSAEISAVPQTRHLPQTRIGLQFLHFRRLVASVAGSLAALVISHPHQ